MTGHTDFFESQYGNYYNLPLWRQRPMGVLTDFVYDVRLRFNKCYRQIARRIEQAPIRSILITGVNVPARSEDLHKVISALSNTRHHVTTRIAPLREGKGKFQNINSGLLGLVLEDYDWLVIIDDDIALPDHFLDTFIYLAEKADLSICQPAHRFRSYQSYAITQREWNTLARVTHYVESGPVTAFRREIYPYVFPFAELRWAWGTDVAWCEIARKQSLRVGIVDATPIGHLRPVGASYNGKLAREEATAHLERLGVTRKRSEILRTVEVISRTDE